MTALPRLYDDLAWVWEIVVAGEDYKSEAELVAGLLAKHARGGGNALLDVGCGAGHHDLYLKERYEVTGIDLSPRMLELARRRNPGLDYQVADMRDFQLGRQFDAIVILDAIAYNTTYSQLGKTLATCAGHLKPGGVLLFYLEESFSLRPYMRPGETVVDSYRQGDTEVILVGNSYDPDPNDTQYEHTFVYLIRRSGQLRVEVDQHQVGLYEMGEIERVIQGLGLKRRLYRWSFPTRGGVSRGPLFVCEKS